WNASIETRSNGPKYHLKIFRSTGAVVSISVVCWFTGAGISRIPFTVDPEVQDLIHTYAVIPPLIIMCQNYYVYFVMSSEYRRVFMNMLKIGKSKNLRLSTSHRNSNILSAVP
ncbi:hypothetical protein OSTOST_15960, partial [Ostertagia ostertagi]